MPLVTHLGAVEFDGCNEEILTEPIELVKNLKREFSRFLSLHRIGNAFQQSQRVALPYDRFKTRSTTQRMIASCQKVWR